MARRLVNGRLEKRSCLRKPTRQGEGAIANAQSAAQFKDVGQTKLAHKVGQKSSVTGERYLPEAAIKSLSSAEYAATTAAKRRDKKRGKQFSAQPKSIMAKTRKYRA